MAANRHKKAADAVDTSKNSKKKSNNKPFLSTAPNLAVTKKSRKIMRKVNREEKKQRRSGGPRLSNGFRKDLDLLDPKPESAQESGEDEVGAHDVYEYQEEVAEEETQKNRRFDQVENYLYETPEHFKDEDVPSDDEVEEDVPFNKTDKESKGRNSHLIVDDDEPFNEADEEGKQENDVILSDLHWDVKDGPVTVQDCLEILRGQPGHSQLSKKLHRVEKKPMTLQAPLPKVQREKLERKVAYKQSSKEVFKWEPLVKRNREAPTLYFNEDVDLGYSTVGQVTAAFEPRTEFEKKMAELVCDPEVKEAHYKDGAKLLELNKISFEEVRDRQNRLAKMRSLLFRHEIKAKHIKKIKSKTYHRILKRERQKGTISDVQMDQEAAKEMQLKQEFKRAEERMTLKHKNRSKWAKRILERGLSVQDEGTQAAFAEQLHQHELLTRKMNSMNDTSSSEESSDEDDELLPEAETKSSSKLLSRAKEKTLKAINEEDEPPKSGLLALPFMERGMRKRQEAVEEEARLALQEYDASLGQLQEENYIQDVQQSNVGGRRTFGPCEKKTQVPSKRPISYNADRSSDSEDGFEAPADDDAGLAVDNSSKDLQLKSALNESESGHLTVFKNFDDIVKDPGPKTTYEVAIFASNSWKKMKAETSRKTEKPLSTQTVKDVHQNSDIDSEEEMIEGFLSQDTKADYELPSQAELVRRAFAGDDVEAEFEKDKMEVLNQENPEPEKPVLLPGWGQWTNIQQKNGLPSWMLKEHEDAKRKREEALKKRKDAHLKHVIISEKVDKKTEKLLTKSLPFPYKSEEVYERSIRMPIGPDYNPAISVGALNRPAVVKKAGIIIKPIQYQDVDPHEKPEEPKHIVHKIGGKPKAKKARTGGKPMKSAA